jgi:DNA-binding response OmpR family regulator
MSQVFGARDGAPLILVVEDEPMIRLSLDVNLRGEGFRTMHAADGADGLAMVRQHPFDGIILDLMMPLKDGWTLLRDLRELPDSVPPVIVLSARGDRERATVLRLGAAAYVSKPFDVDELVALVQRTAREAVGAGRA